MITLSLQPRNHDFLKQEGAIDWRALMCQKRHLGLRIVERKNKSPSRHFPSAASLTGQGPKCDRLKTVGFITGPRCKIYSKPIRQSRMQILPAWSTCLGRFLPSPSKACRILRRAYSRTGTLRYSIWHRGDEHDKCGAAANQWHRTQRWNPDPLSCPGSCYPPYPLTVDTLSFPAFASLGLK